MVNFLTQEVAKLSSDIVIPSTEDKNAYRHLYENQAEGKKNKLLGAINITYSECLPVPRPDVSLKKIIRLRHKRSDELERLNVALNKFRRVFQECDTIEQMEVEIAACKTEI